MSSSQYFKPCEDIDFFFYGTELIGPLFAFVIFEIFSDLQ